MSNYNITVRAFSANVASGTFGGVVELPVANVAGLLVDAGSGLKPVSSGQIRIPVVSLAYGGTVISKLKGFPRLTDLVDIELFNGGDWSAAKAIIPQGIRAAQAGAVAVLWTQALAGGATEVKDATGLKKTSGGGAANAAVVQAAAANQEMADLKALVAQQAAMLQALMTQMTAAAAPAPAAEVEAPKTKK